MFNIVVLRLVLYLFNLRYKVFMRFKLLAIFACILWGSAFAGAKIGFEYMEPIRLSGFRFTLAGLLLWPLLLTKGISFKRSLRHWKFILFFAMLQTFLQYGLFFMGLNKVPGSTAAVIVGAGPLFVAVLAHFTMGNDFLSLRKIIAICLGIFGVVFISLTKGDISGSGFQFYLGIGILILSNLVGATTNIVVAKQSRDLSPIALTSFANFFGGLMLIMLSYVVEDSKNVGYPPQFWGVLLWLSLISAVGFSIWYTLLNKPGVKVSELNMWKFIIPVTGCILSWIFLPNESPDFYSIVGIISITSALLLMQLPLPKKKMHSLR